MAGRVCIMMIDADYNDLGFSVGNRLMVLVESQLTWTYNIIIRVLMYMVQTYHDYFKRTNQNLYGSKKVNIPTPKSFISRKRKGYYWAVYYFF